MLRNHSLGVVENAVGAGVGEDDLKPVLVAELPHPLGGNGADGRELDGLIAHFLYLGQREVQVLLGLGILPQGEQLSA